jgi:hypothetical protein
MLLRYPGRVRGLEGLVYDSRAREESNLAVAKWTPDKNRAQLDSAFVLTRQRIKTNPEFADATG